MSQENERGRIDTDALKEGIDIVDVIGGRIELKRHGKEWKGLCPFHTDTDPSLCVIPAKQLWWCPVCNEGGDVIDFVAQFENIEFKEACKRIRADLPRVAGDYIPPARAKKKESAPERIAEVAPYEEGLPDLTGAFAFWTYHTAAAEPWFYVARYNRPEISESTGKPKKFFVPFTWNSADGWQKKAPPSPRPLYNLEKLSMFPELPVCLFEGEKCADAGEKFYKDSIVCSAWPGGAGSVEHADLTPLQGRKVFIWPDNDDASRKCVEALLNRLRTIAREVWVINPEGQTKGWDAADALAQGWGRSDLLNFFKQIVGGRPRVFRHAYAETVKPAALIPSPAMTPVITQKDRLPDMPNGSTHDLAMSAMNWENQRWQHLLVCGGKNKSTPMKVFANACVPLRWDEQWKGALKYDMLRQVVRCTRALPWNEFPAEWGDHHITRSLEWFQRSRLFMSKEMVSDAIELVAHENEYHPVQEYLKQLKWDGKARIDHWLTTYAGVVVSNYTQFVGKSWLISAVARAMKPGCMVKTALVLISKQDYYKSTMLNVLGGEFFGVQVGILRGDAIKAREQCNKLWIIEGSELSVAKLSEIETVKEFISTTADTYRPAFGRYVKTLPRSCVFAFTTNNDEFLLDATGNVRFWPVELTCEIDIDQIRADRDQLWAEAFDRWSKGEPYWITDQGIAREARMEQDKRLITDDWMILLDRWLLENPDRPSFTSTELLTQALGVEYGRQDLSAQKRVGNLLRRMGCRRGSGKLMGRAGRVWLRPESTEG